MYLLRSSPTFQHPDLRADFGECLMSCDTYICNVSLDAIGWIQATLPIRLGGIGFRRATDISLPGYLTSISASRYLISEIALLDCISHTTDSCIDVWSSTNQSLHENPNLQRQWANIKLSSHSGALKPMLSQLRLARLSSATQPTWIAWMAHGLTVFRQLQWALCRTMNHFQLQSVNTRISPSVPHTYVVVELQ